MTTASKKEDVPQDGIWGQVEQEELMKEGSGVDEVSCIHQVSSLRGVLTLQIVAIDKKGGEKFTVWKRDGSAKRDLGDDVSDIDQADDGTLDNINEISNPDLFQRDNMQTCMSDEEYAEFDDEVNW